MTGLSPAPPIGTVAQIAPAASAPPARTAAVPFPAIGSVATVPPAAPPLVPAAVRGPYQPPAALLPDPPKITGKWEPEYTADRKSYVVPGLDGIRQTDTLTRATSHAKALDDATNLMDWKLRAAVLGMARNPEILDSLHVNGAEHISELDYFSKKVLNKLANKAARSVGADDGSLFGTKLHNYLEAILEGAMTLDQVPNGVQPYLIAMFAAMRAHGLSFVSKMVERTVFIPATGMIGTLDFLTLTKDGELLVGDLKTSSSIDFSWLSIAVQLAQYANATMMLSWDGTRWEQMPQVSKVIAKVAVVPKDAPIPFCRIYTINLGIGAEMMNLATRIRELRETAMRVASRPELRREGDELLAWADGQPVMATTSSGPAAA